MANRRDDLLDAAIDVLGRRGVRALTHRAVDDAARLPAGTTSNYFRTRDALFDGVVGRVVERERIVFETLAVVAPPSTPRELARALAAFVRAATGPNRELTLSRFALLVEAANQPALAEKMAAGARAVNEWSEKWVLESRLPNPRRNFGFLARQVDALTLHQLAHPDPEFDPESILLTLVELLTRSASHDPSPSRDLL